ncbi:inositol 2-dehydrogenase [Vibrio natriegens]|uniref:inositol 2-dehydrogenase n=1 Tax=Vibrio natriegens TaxID=691 RepID=UPI0008043BF2|nr:inositol 2-dehydrogenase [Vibrio natriegens]ANQ23796.1 inositol 2-dehydrogenase [Vibrio natriegens]MCY9876948.1 inositol 2-dehydrogenase [Vibrio natriegens]
MLNIALLGAGKMGSIHADNIFRHQDTNLYSIVDTIQENADNLAKKYNTKIQTLEQAMNDSNIHGVWISSASHTHADLIELAAKHKKAIFCEKPIHLDPERVVKSLEIVKDNNVPLIMGFNRRFDPQFSRVKQLSEKGEIGKKETLLIISRDPAPPPIEYIPNSGGLFKDMMIHDFDMARFIMGEEPVSINAQGSNLVDKQIEKLGDIDTAIVTIKFQSGAIATIMNSRRSGYGYDQRLELHGDKGLLCAGNVYENQVSCWTASGKSSAPPEHFYLQRYKDAYAAELEHFIEVMQGKMKSSCSGQDGQKALLMAIKAQESLNNNKEVYF